MKILVYGCLLLSVSTAKAQEKAENLFIITTDGVRWNEVFNGADPALISNPHFVKDTALARLLYWDDAPDQRRKSSCRFFGT